MCVFTCVCVGVRTCASVCGGASSPSDPGELRLTLLRTETGLWILKESLYRISETLVFPRCVVCLPSTREDDRKGQGPGDKNGKLLGSPRSVSGSRRLPQGKTL